MIHVFIDYLFIYFRKCKSTERLTDPTYKPSGLCPHVHRYPVHINYEPFPSKESYR